MRERARERERERERQRERENERESERENSTAGGKIVHEFEELKRKPPLCPLPIHASQRRPETRNREQNVTEREGK